MPPIIDYAFEHYPNLFWHPGFTLTVLGIAAACGLAFLITRGKEFAVLGAVVLLMLAPVLRIFGC